MELSEENLTQIIKDALAHYKAKEFGCAKYVQIENGFVVQFYDGPFEESSKRKSDDDDTPKTSNPLDISDLSNLTNPISPFNIFGGFGGGSSGGGGASGDW